MFGRREFLIGAGALGVAAAQPSSRLSGRTRHVDPRAFGARGNGITDDTRAVNAAFSEAFDQGLPVDGGAALFAVREDLRISGAAKPWIRSLRLRQLSPSDDRKTLYFHNCEAIRIDRLQVDVGTSRATGYMNESGGLWIDGGSDHDVRNVEVFGDGKNSLIAIWNTSKSSYASLSAHDAAYDSPVTKDDVLQGIFLLQNIDCILQSPRVSNLHGNASSRFPNRFTRGIALGGNLRVRILDAEVGDVDQGIDITGSNGNRQCAVLRAHCVRCNAVGVKLANSAVGCRVMDSVAERCGLVGFLASGPSEAGLRYKTEDCDFIRCTALDIGYNGFADSAPHAGFRVERNRYDPDYPRGVRFIGCRSIDRQRIKTMEYGFYSHVDLVGTKPNQLINCHSEGHSRAPTLGRWG
jgi:hypothetical protein